MFSKGLSKMLQGERVHRSCSQKRSEPLMHKLISQELAQIPQMIGSQSRHAASKRLWLFSPSRSSSACGTDDGDANDVMRFVSAEAKALAMATAPTTTQRACAARATHE